MNNERLFHASEMLVISREISVFVYEEIIREGGRRGRGRGEEGRARRGGGVEFVTKNGAECGGRESVAAIEAGWGGRRIWKRNIKARASGSINNDGR